MSDAVLRKELRIVLDPSATEAYNVMVKRLKEDSATVKVQPSQFISFLVLDFFKTYFEKDKTVLIAEFFDSDTYFDTARKKAKGSVDYEEQMAASLAEAQKIKSRRRDKTATSKKTIIKSNIVVTP